MKLKDQVALITGASGGIGQAIALRLAQEGAKLAVAGRQWNKLEALAAQARGSAADVRVYQADLSKEEEVARLSQEVLRHFGCVDILVHSVGVTAMGRVETAPVQDFDWQYAINVRAPYLLTQALLATLSERRGQIVFINSTAGLRSRARLAQYGASKHALKAVAESVRAEVNPHGVRVLSIFLGRTATPMQAETFKLEGREYRPEVLIQPEDVAAMVISALSLPRSAEVTEIRIRPLVKSY